MSYLKLLIQSKYESCFLILTSTKNQQRPVESKEEEEIKFQLNGFFSQNLSIRKNSNRLMMRDEINKSASAAAPPLDYYRFRIDSTSLFKKYLNDYDFLAYFLPPSQSSSLSSSMISASHRNQPESIMSLTSNTLREIESFSIHLVMPNRTYQQRAMVQKEAFDCKICLTNGCSMKECGFVLKKCLHTFCK